VLPFLSISTRIVMRLKVHAGVECYTVMNYKWDGPMKVCMEVHNCLPTCESRSEENKKVAASGPSNCKRE
jgi:hypothetical protein